MKFKKVVIIGMGLIGGSIGRALIEGGLADKVVGICRRQSSLDRAVEKKTLTAGHINNYEEAVAGADMVIIATPVHTIMEILKVLSGVITNSGTVVTDVGSTKKEIVNCAAEFRDRFSFVGGHPLAGSEKAGVEYADAGLFHDSVCVLTPDSRTRKEDVNKVKDLWESIGASVYLVDPEKHDTDLAFSSHLPHIAAYALAGTLKKGISAAMFAGGFKDTTRIASSDAALWSDIFMSNRDNVLEAIKRYKEVLSGIENDISRNAKEELEERLKDCKRKRDEVL
jgi:prephenate dehydrogenase